MNHLGLLFAACLITTSFPSVANEGEWMSKEYFNGKGSMIKVEKIKDDNLIVVSGKDPGGYEWQSVGFYSRECSCIKSAFRYTSHKDKYGEQAGYHKFLLKDGGKVIVKYGGWDVPNEFGPDQYTRK